MRDPVPNLSGTTAKLVARLPSKPVRTAIRGSKVQSTTPLSAGEVSHRLCQTRRHHRIAGSVGWRCHGRQSASKAASELTELQEGLTDDEKALMKKSIDDLIRDTPQTTVAAHRVKQLAAKAGTTALDGFRTILINVVSETAKKILFP